MASFGSFDGWKMNENVIPLIFFNKFVLERLMEFEKNTKLLKSKTTKFFSRKFNDQFLGEKNK